MCCRRYRVDITWRSKPNTSARNAWYEGLDHIVSGCRFTVHSKAFKRSMVEWGIPAGKKTTKFSAADAQRIK